MSIQVRGSNVSAEAAETISRYQLLYLNSTGKWAVATATSAAAIAVAADNAASGSPVTGVLLSGGGSLKLIASGAISVNAAVYQTAAGKISSTPTGVLVGFANQAATTDADLIEVRAATPGETIARGSAIRAYTADATLGEAQSGLTITNLGASGTITISLPTSCPAGTRFYFAVQAAQRLQIDPGANDAIFFSGAKQADGKYLWADDEAESVILISDANNDWVATHVVGTWTIEP